jgi:hypothetical protein
MKLSIVCVTQAAPKVRPFLEEIKQLAEDVNAELVFGAHGDAAAQFLRNQTAYAVEGEFLEEMLNPVLELCTGDYVLRLDDDERCSESMFKWLKAGLYVERSAWFFPRFHFWPDEQHVITSQPYFPDFQARLTRKDMAQREAKIHAGLLFRSFRAPVYMEHYNQIVKTYEERRALTAKYETIRTGVPMTAAEVNVVWPEDAPAGAVTVEPMGPNLLRRTYSHGYYAEVAER